MNCLIIEDEKPAQRVLQQFIANSPGLELKATFRTAMEAQSFLSAGQADLIFLDINLPLISGIALLKGLKNPPLVILTTAYSEYALEGFELDVVDYLLKPFSFERFVKATNKAFRLFNSESKTSGEAVKNTVNEQIIINVDKVLHKLSVTEIIYIASDKDYVCFHTPKRKYMFLGSLKNWADKLRVSGFCRVHKSYVVNLSHIAKVEGNTIHLPGTELPIGRSYRGEFMEAFAG